MRGFGVSELEALGPDSEGPGPFTENEEVGRDCFAPSGRGGPSLEEWNPVGAGGLALASGAIGAD